MSVRRHDRQAHVRTCKNGSIILDWQKVWIDMPEQVELMLAYAQGLIAHQPKARLERKHGPPMHDGIGQTGEPIMATYKEIEILTIDPLFRANVGQTTPTERTLGLCLIESVDCQRVVSFGAAK